MSQETTTTTTIQLYDIALKIAKEMSKCGSCEFYQSEDRDIKALVVIVEAFAEDMDKTWAKDYMTQRFSKPQCTVIKRHIRLEIGEV